MHPRRMTFFLALCALPISQAMAAGPLDPLAAPAPTMKTLEEVEPRIPIDDLPFVITNSGSYYLTRNLFTGGATTTGIVIMASRVTIDLMGFTLRGEPGTGDGISVPTTQRDLIIRNGMIHSWGGNGIGGFPYYTTVSDIKTYSNGINGITLIFHGTIERCTATANKSFGFSLSLGTVRQCNAVANGNGYLTGYSTFVDCIAYGNKTNGFMSGSMPGLSGDSIFRSCIAYNNGGAGFISFGTSQITDCLANNNNTGIVVTATSVRSCTAEANRYDGIVAQYNSVVIDSRARVNGTVGSGAGILVTGDDNRIDGNTLNDNDVGVQVTGSQNTIQRNHCEGNTADYAIGAGNAYGPIAVVGGVGDITSVTNARHPFANFSY